jgi:hypothetical protein
MKLQYDQISRTDHPAQIDLRHGFLINNFCENSDSDPMAPTKALIARDESTKTVWRRDAEPIPSSIATDPRSTTSETGLTDTRKSAPLYKVLFAIAGAIAVTVVTLYGATDFLVRWRQQKADLKHAEQQELEKMKEKVRQKVWIRIAKEDPEIFVEKIILRKDPRSSERLAAITVLSRANPGWVKAHEELLSGIEFHNETILEGLGEDSHA